MRMTRANLEHAIATPGFNWRQFGQQYGRDGNRVGPGRRTIDSIMSRDHTRPFGRASKGKYPDTRTGMPRPAVGPHYDDFVITRQLKRQLARMTAKAQRHSIYLAARRATHSGRKAVACGNV